MTQKLALQSIEMTIRMRSTHFAAIYTIMTNTPCWTWMKGPTGCFRQTGPPGAIHAYSSSFQQMSGAAFFAEHTSQPLQLFLERKPHV